MAVHTQKHTDTDHTDGPNLKVGAGPVNPELLELLRYAFARIEFLEADRNIEYGPKDLLVPAEVALL